MTKPKSSRQKRKMKNAIRRRRVLLLLFLAAALISICLFTPFFNVKTVEVIGNENLTAEQLLSAASIPDGINIFKVHTGSVKKSLLQIPEVETVKLRRKLPAKIQLEITETRPVMVFPYLTGYVSTNENGRAMALMDSFAEQNLLYITGLEINNVEICKKISVQDTVTFDIIVDTIQKLQNAGLLSEIKSCHFENITDCHMYLTDGTKVIFGKTTEMEYKISVLAGILPRVDRTEGAYIDLTTPSRAIYGILEPVAEEPETKVPEEENTEEEAIEEGTAEEAQEESTEKETAPQNAEVETPAPSTPPAE